MEEPKRNAKDQKHCKTEIRNAFNEFSRLGTTEKRISELEDFSIGFCQTEKQTEKIVKKKKGDRISKNCGTTTKGTVWLQWEDQRRKEKGTEGIFEIMTENFPKLMSDIKPQIQKVQGTPRRNPSTLLRHIIFKYRKSNIKKNPKVSQKTKAPLL